MLSQYPDRVQTCLQSAPDLFQIGLHGPDILFYYKPLKKDPVNRLGSALHDLPAGEFFRHGADVLRDPANAAVRQHGLAYLIGFLCHFALDSICHGYIEKKIQVSGLSHTEIETEFDRYLMVRDGKDPIRHRTTGHIHPNGPNAEVISRFFDGISAQQVLRSLKSMIRYHSLLIAPQEWKRRLIFLVLKAAGSYQELHSLVVNRQPNALCADSCIRLEKLMRQAQQLCLRLTENFMDCLNGKENGLNRWFERTFSAPEDWPEIPVYSLEKELKYEI